MKEKEPAAEDFARETQREYAAFISYRHLDNQMPGRQWATWLHQALETYDVPSDLVGKTNQRGESIPEALYPVFRDEDEAPADANLAANIDLALRRSRVLIVLCSPRAVASRLVAQEIRTFKELGKSGRVLALIIDGEPNVADDPAKQKALELGPDAECLPEPLRFGVPDLNGRIDWTQRTEPIAADVRPKGLPVQGWTNIAAYRSALEKEVGSRQTNREMRANVKTYEERLQTALLKVVAGCLGVSLGELTKRDKVHRLRKARRLAGMLGSLAGVALLAAVIAWWQSRVAREQKDLAVQREQAAHMQLAALYEERGRQELAGGQLARAAPFFLEAWRENPRSAEQMRTLLGFAVQPLQGQQALLQGHNDPIVCVAWSPDGRWIATGGSTGTVKLWDATGFRLKQSFELENVPGFSVTRLAFSPDASLLAAAAESEGRFALLRLDAVGAGPLLRTHGFGAVHAFAFSPDGSHLVTAGDGKLPASPDSLKLWRLPDGVLEASWCPGKTSLDVAFNADGGKLLSTADDQTLSVWNARSHLEERSIKYTSILQRAAFSPNGTQVLASGSDVVLATWNLADGKLQAEAKPEVVPRQPLLEINPHTGRFALIQDMNLVTGGGGLPVTTTPVTDFVVQAKLSPDGKFAAVCYSNGSAGIFDLAKGTWSALVKAHQGMCADAEFSPDNSRFVTVGQDRHAIVWDRGKLTWPAALGTHRAALVEIQTGPLNEAWLASVTKLDAACWDTKSGKELCRIVHPADPAADGIFGGMVVACRPASHLFATAGPDKAARLWRLPDGKALGELSHPRRVVGVALDGSGQRVATACWDDVVRVWNVGTKQTECTLAKPVHDVVLDGLQFDPAGSRLLTVSSKDGATVWDLPKGEPLFSLTGHSAKLKGAVFSLKGHWLASWSEDRTVRVFDGAGIFKFAVEGLATEPVLVVFDDDESTLAAADRRGTVLFVDLLTKKIKARWENVQRLTPKVLRFWPSGDLAAVALANEIHVVSTVSGLEVHSFKLSNRIGDFVVAPDGLFIRAAVGDGFGGGSTVITLPCAAPVSDLSQAATLLERVDPWLLREGRLTERAPATP